MFRLLGELLGLEKPDVKNHSSRKPVLPLLTVHGESFLAQVILEGTCAVLMDWVVLQSCFLTFKSI